MRRRCIRYSATTSRYPLPRLPRTPYLIPRFTRTSRGSFLLVGLNAVLVRWQRLFGAVRCGLGVRSFL